MALEIVSGSASDVAADNEPALRAYESLGFARVGEFLADEHCRIPETGQDGPS